MASVLSAPSAAGPIHRNDLQTFWLRYRPLPPRALASGMLDAVEDGRDYFHGRTSVLLNAYLAAGYFNERWQLEAE